MNFSVLFMNKPILYGVCCYKILGTQKNANIPKSKSKFNLRSTHGFVYLLAIYWRNALHVHGALYSFASLTTMQQFAKLKNVLSLFITGC